MNETYAILAKQTRRAKTQKLAAKLTRAMRGENVKTKLSALLLVLVDEHLGATVGKNGEVCVPCVSGSLTELIQALRGFHDQCIDAIPSGLVERNHPAPPPEKDP